MTCVLRPVQLESDVRYFSEAASGILTKGRVGFFTAAYNKTYNKTLRASYPIEHVNDGVNRLFRLTNQPWGNSLAADLYAIRVHGTIGHLSDAQSVELLLQGLIELVATYNRMYYTAHNASGSRNIQGNFTIQYYGWNGGKVRLIAAGIPLLLVLAITAICCALFWSAKTIFASDFDPTDSASLIVASSAGGASGNMPSFKGEGRIQTVSKDVFDVRLCFRGEHGLCEIGNGASVSYRSDVSLEELEPSMSGRKKPDSETYPMVTEVGETS